MSASVTRCVRCRQQRCLCGEIPRVVTSARFVIVRHRAERSRASNTGHFAALAVAGCELLDYGARDAPFDERQLAVGEGTWLLFPTPGAAAWPARAPERIIVLDGSWPQARHMRQRMTALRGLPLLSLPPPDPARRRQRRLHAEGMTTLEAIARAIALLDGAERAAPLERLHDAIVDAAARDCAQLPARPQP